MKKKALLSYLVLLATLFGMHALRLRMLDYLVPLYLVCVPLFFGRRIRTDISSRQLIFSLAVSAVVLIPYYFVAAPHRPPVIPGLWAAAFQLLAVSLPEEIFFRGFLQETLGNTPVGVVAVSLLFAAAHLPAYFYNGDVHALFTFFPSLVMGFLYLRTRSVVPPTLFHFLANVLYRGAL